jgi:hypothetical protein
MTILKKIVLFISVLFLANCASYKAKKQEAQLNLPALGSIVKTKGDLLYAATESIGIPKWYNLEVAIQELPFNADSYFTYAKHIHNAGKINTIPYNDSLRFKPKYIRLQLQNRIEVTKVLNKESLRETREYISLDKNHKLVSAIDVAFTENEIANFNSAQGAYLTMDKFANLILVLNKENGKQEFLFKDLPSFNYKLSSFCWGEDRYHNVRIENIVSAGDGCPKNTYQKASKIKSNREYLKF